MIKTLTALLLCLSIGLSSFSQLKSKSVKTHPPIKSVQPPVKSDKRTLTVTGRDVHDTTEIQVMYIVEENGDTTSYLGLPGYEIHNWFVSDSDPTHPTDAGIVVLSHEWTPLVQFKDFVFYYRRPKTMK